MGPPDGLVEPRFHGDGPAIKGIFLQNETLNHVNDRVSRDLPLVCSSLQLGVLCSLLPSGAPLDRHDTNPGLVPMVDKARRDFVLGTGDCDALLVGQDQFVDVFGRVSGVTGDLSLRVLMFLQKPLAIAVEQGGLPLLLETIPFLGKSRLAGCCIKRWPELRRILGLRGASCSCMKSHF